MKTFIALLFLTILTGCKKIPIPDRFYCMSTPSGMYVPGTVLRTLNIADAKDKNIDDLTLAYGNKKRPSHIVGYADYSYNSSNSLSAKLISKSFKKLGFTGNININADYNLNVKAKGNTHMVADDNHLKIALQSFQGSEAIVIKDAKYFFIKEALASDMIEYEANSSNGAKASVDIEAINSDLAVGMDINKGGYNVKGNKLFACVVIESLDVATVGGYSGEDTLEVTMRKPASIKDYEILDKSN